MQGATTDDESSTEAVDSFLLKERSRSASVSSQIPRKSSVPRTLNARASLIIAANPRNSGSPPMSPRSRNVSLGIRRDVASSQLVAPTTNTTTTTSTKPIEEAAAAAIAVLASDTSCDEEDDEERERKAYLLQEAQECAELEATRRFITDTMKRKNKPPTKMSIGSLNFFDQPLSSAAASDFCVTEHSTPCGTPPPERSMPYDVSFKEIALLKQDIKKLRDEVKYMHEQQQSLNNFYIKFNNLYATLLREREEEQQKSCWSWS